MYSFQRQSSKVLSQTLRRFSKNIGGSVKINWKLKDGSIISSTAPVGTNVMEAAHMSHIDIEGACGGVCACSTCHVILENDMFDILPEATEEEEDMLDQAFGLTASSRLGCQVVLEAEHDNMVVTLPSATRNFYVDGHVPEPH